MDPNFALAHDQPGQAYSKNKWTMRRSQNCKKRSSFPTAARHALPILLVPTLYQAQGTKLRLLNGLKQRTNPGYSNASDIAGIYAALGDRDQAMSWLEKAYQERFSPSILVRPAFDPLRSDPQFEGLVRRIELPR
jgi:hypothetical protein